MTPGRLHRHEDHRLLLVLRRGGVGLAHEDRDLAARIHGAGGPPFAAVDDVSVAVAADVGLDVGGVGRGDRGLGHREAGADLAVEQRLQPFLLVRLAAVADDRLHVAGVGRRAVERLRADRRAAHDLAEMRVFLVRERVGVFALRQEQVPQALRLRLGLELLHDRRHVPAARQLLELTLEHVLGRIDVLLHEGGDALLQVFDAGGEGEEHGFVLTRFTYAGAGSQSSGARRWDPG